MARLRPLRGDGGFTLLEVLIALAIFVMAAVVLAASYLNILNSYAAAGKGLQENIDVSCARNELMQISDLTTAQAGDEFDTPDNPNDHTRHVKWTADIEPTTTTDLFTVTLTVMVSGGSTAAATYTDIFTLLRPTWSDPTDRSTLRQTNATRVQQLQGRTVK